MNLGFAKRQFGKIVAATVLVTAAVHTNAGDLSLPVTGNLLGSVVDASGIPQMGATVQLLNKYARPIAETITTPDGRFAFANLPADFYSIRVSLASFLPASREKIAIKAGLNSVLQIHLATLFSSIELNYTFPDAAMTDDWKWVLRSSPATRPITRYLPVEETSSTEMHPRIFSGTHAMLSMSGGDGGLIDSDSTEAGFGTGFALSTNVFGKNQVQVGGALGEGANLGPSAMGIAAIYSRSDSWPLTDPPEVTFTMTQVGGLGGQLSNQSAGAPVLGGGPGLRTMSLSVYQTSDPVDGVHIEYGATGESVDYLQHTSRVSPFARVTLGAGRGVQLIAAYSDGGRPDELFAHQQYQAAEEATDSNQNSELADTVSALARLPQLSNRNGRLELQRTARYELGLNKQAGSRTYAVSAFYEDVLNGRINVAGNLSALNTSDLLSDEMSTTSTYDVGNYRRNGYIASVNQNVSDSLDLAVAYGRMGGFTGDPAGLLDASGPAARFLNEGDHNIAAANLHAHIPRAGTRIYASYGWVDSGAVIPLHVFATQNTYVAPGLNIQVRQPLPSFFGIPGRLELTADLRNLLAQGYIPFNTGDGHTLLIVQAPKAVRGGLNFTF